MTVKIIGVSFIIKLFSNKKTKHNYAIQTWGCILSSECCINRRINIISIINAFYFFVFSSLIDDGTVCLNSYLTGNCPGGYLQVQKGLWETNVNCGSGSDYEGHFATAHLKNKCNNKTICDFKATDSSFNVSCTYSCTRFVYIYNCISKSFVLFIVKCFLVNLMRTRVWTVYYERCIKRI